MNMGLWSTIFEFIGANTVAIFAVGVLIRWSNMGNKKRLHK